MADVFHTFFGICGLLLINHFKGTEFESLEQIDPTYALPRSLVKKLGLFAEVRPPVLAE
jgi:geranylgeranyl transferase type-2 subunit beta